MGHSNSIRHNCASAADCRCAGASSSSQPCDPHRGESCHRACAKDRHHSSPNTSPNARSSAADDPTGADPGGGQECAAPSDAASSCPNTSASSSANLQHRDMPMIEV